MLERFRAVFGPRRHGDAGAGWFDERLSRIAGYMELAQEFAGVTFDAGLYRIHDTQTGPQALELIAEVFPELAQRACPFAYDWLGRHFAVDDARVVRGQPQVLLLEPGTAAALEIPVSFAAFHDDELIEHADAALAADFFTSWSAHNADALPLLRDQCVGYKVPLFVGGEDTINNLEVNDMDVYWSVCGQLRRQIR